MLVVKKNMCSESNIWTMTNRVNLFFCQIAYLRLVMNYEKPEYTQWHYVKPREDGIFTSVSEKYEQPYWFLIYMSDEHL